MAFELNALQQRFYEIAQGSVGTSAFARAVVSSPQSFFQENPADIPIVMGDTAEERAEMAREAEIERLKETGFGQAHPDMPVRVGPVSAIGTAIARAPRASVLGETLINPEELNQGEMEFLARIRGSGFASAACCCPRR